MHAWRLLHAENLSSPAHCAAAKGHIEGLRLLKDKKGDLWLQNVKGEYPIHEAALAKENGAVVIRRCLIS